MKWGDIMNGSLFEYPHTSYYGSDLQELIRMYKQLTEDYSGIKSSIEECLHQIENFGDYVDEEIQKGLAVAIANIDSRMSIIEKKFESTHSELLKLKNDVSTMASDVRAEVDELRTLIYNLGDNLRAEIRVIYDLFEKFRHEVDEEIDYKTQTMLDYINDYITRLERLSVTNPFTGEFMDIQIVLNEICNYIVSGYGLTAKEYDDMQISASQYDNLLISAMNYSMRGFFMFFEHFYMKVRSPFTGNMETYREIINRLINFHKNSLTAQEYDDKLLDADSYETLSISSYDYDWNGLNII